MFFIFFFAEHSTIDVEVNSAVNIQAAAEPTQEHSSGEENQV
jgi:hypothetical protein